MHEKKKKPKSIAQDPTSKETATGQAPQKLEVFPGKLYNKLEDNYHLSNKKALFLNMRNYYESLQVDPFSVLPLTFHIKTGLDDPEFQNFTQHFEANKDKTWIIKPGENTNRGNGISVSKDFTEI